MKAASLAIIILLLFSKCNSTENKTLVNPEPLKHGIEKNENQNKPNPDTCIFSIPDTSVASIHLRNPASTLNILGKQIKLDGDSTHFFYSADKKQLIGLTVHPGDLYNSVSCFTISYAKHSKSNYRQLRAVEFET